MWKRRGQDETEVHELLRQFRVEHAPSREYFRLPIKTGSDLVERVLYNCANANKLEAEGESDKNVGVNKKRKIVMCASCKKIQATLCDADGQIEHLFLVTTPLFQDMVGIMPSSDPHNSVKKLETELPSRLELRTIWHGQGRYHEAVRHELGNFRADSPGDWYHMSPQPASAVVSKILFGNVEDDVEPGIIVKELEAD